MFRYLMFLWLMVFIFPAFAAGQVKIRLFASSSPESMVFTVTEGEYEITGYKGGPDKYIEGDLIFISKYRERLAVKPGKGKGYVCDSIAIYATTKISSFSLRINGINPVRQQYRGDLVCYPDLETLVLINICDVESYITGVVRAEGGIRKSREYFKTQAIIARTYLYKHLDKHLNDNYDLCDNTHCQAFNGVSSDTLINAASFETHGLVILDSDSSLINSSFHSNCGGMTSSSEDIWISQQPYLRSVTDPYCTSSRNAGWELKLSSREWLDYLLKSGYSGKTNVPSLFNYSQDKRLVDYKTGSFTLSLKKMRDDFKLRSTFFSVVSGKDSVLLKGRGYGHGVGLCQEGAMEMAARGNNYSQIIDFYYFGVLITDIKNAVYRTVAGSRQQATGGQ